MQLAFHVNHVDGIFLQHILQFRALDQQHLIFFCLRMRIAIEALVGDEVFLELDLRESTPVVGFPSHDVPDRIPAQSRIVPGRLLCLCLLYTS